MLTTHVLIGKRFGNLVVIERYGKTNDGNLIWLCKCDCGAVVPIRAKRLLYGKELYCGDSHPTKICTSCKKEKDKEKDYHKSNTEKGSINPKCKDCIAQWYTENKEAVRENYLKRREDAATVTKMRERGRRYRNNNLDKEKEYKKKYTQRESFISRRKEKHTERKMTDMNYNIKRRLRWRIRDVFRSLGTDRKKYRYKSSLVLLGCDMEFFKSYIESKFTDGMCWERIAGIHVDHIIPCSYFDLTKPEEQLICFNYSNLQPLWGEDNMKKGSKYDPTLKDN